MTQPDGNGSTATSSTQTSSTRTNSTEPASDAVAASSRSGGANADVEAMSYEQAREELVAVVSQLEAGGAGLEQSLKLWERGEALAQHCEAWLEGARRRLDAARATSAAEENGQ